MTSSRYRRNKKEKITYGIVLLCALLSLCALYFSTLTGFAALNTSKNSSQVDLNLNQTELLPRIEELNTTKPQEINDNDTFSAHNLSNGTLLQNNTAKQINESKKLLQNNYSENNSEQNNSDLPTNYKSQNLTAKIIEENLTHNQIVIGRPVKWTKIVKFNDVASNASITIHREAENIVASSIKNGTTEQISSLAIKTKHFGKEVPISAIGISGGTVYQVSNWVKLKIWISSLSFGLTGFATNVISDNEMMNLTITENATEIKIEYETPGPQVQEITLANNQDIIRAESEKNSLDAKRIIVRSPVHYEHIFAFTNVAELPRSRTKLYQVFDTGNKLVNNVTYLDTNNDNKIDRIEWIIPHLSDKEFLVHITSGSCDVEIDTCKGANWETDTVYCLNASINNVANDCMVINNNTVTLNCQGFTIDGDALPTGNDIGIEITQKNNVTIEDCIITEFDFGIYGEETTNATVQNCTISTHDTDGVRFYKSNYTDLINNTISTNTYGINITGATAGAIKYASLNNRIINNTINANMLDGIYVEDSNSTTLHNNSVSTNNGLGIRVLTNVSHNSITNNTLTSNTGGGIAVLAPAYQNTISNNTISICDATATSAINITGNDSSITNNVIISGNYSGYWITGSNNTLTNNTVNDSVGGYGFYISASNNTLISNNAHNNSLGNYWLENAENCILTSNIATTSDAAGIYLEMSNGTTLTSNTVNNNSNGIYIYKTSNCVFTNNTAENSSNHDFISLGTLAVSCTNNTITNLEINNVTCSLTYVGDFNLTDTTTPTGIGTKISLHKSLIFNTELIDWMFLNMSYSGFSATSVNESTIAIWNNTGGWNTISGASRNTTGDYAYANITSASVSMNSTFSLLGSAPTSSSDDSGGGGGGGGATEEEEKENETIINITNEAPICDIDYNKKAGCIPMTLNLKSESTDSDGQITSINWSIDGKLVINQTEITQKFNDEGKYSAALFATDNNGSNCTKTLAIVAKNCTVVEEIIDDIKTTVNMAAKKTIKVMTAPKELSLTEKLAWGLISQIILGAIGAACYLVYKLTSKTEPVVHHLRRHKKLIT